MRTADGRFVMVDRKRRKSPPGSPRKSRKRFPLPPNTTPSAAKTPRRFCDVFRFTPLQKTRTQAEEDALYQRGVDPDDDDINKLTHRIAIFVTSDDNGDVYFGAKNNAKNALSYSGAFRGDGQNVFATYLRRHKLPKTCKELEQLMVAFANVANG